MVKFFGKVDRKEGGKIKSQYPAWFFDKQIDDLKESIESQERLIKSGAAREVSQDMEARLERDKQRYKDILESRPELSEGDKDELNKRYKEFGSKIQESMFTHTDMEKGFASPNEEAHRMSDPIIEIKDKGVEILKECNVIPIDGKVSRNQLTKAWQIIGKALGESTNAETLRRSGVTSKKYIVK